MRSLGRLWRGSLFRAQDWKSGSMKLLNACSEPLGIRAGKKQLRVPRGKSVDFHSRNWGEPFPVKIYRLGPEQRAVFSSTWRVTAGRRELCVIGDVNGAITLRSLLELTAPRAAAPPSASNR